MERLDRLLRLGVIPGLLAVLSACSGPHPAGPVEKTGGESVAVAVNARAPAFAAHTLDGATVRLADFVGTHVVLLEFWSIFCKSCIQEMPRIERLYRRYRDKGLAVLSINTDVFSAERIRKVLRKAGLSPPYPVLRDVRQEIVGAYGVEVLPVTVIIDREGWIRFYQEGYRPGDEARFEREVRRWLGAGEASEVALAPHGGSTAFAPAGPRLVEPGTKVERWSVQTLEGGTVALGPGQPLLLYFWSLYCQPCRAEFSTVTALARRYAGQGVRAYAVNVDSARLAERVRRFLRARGELPCLVDWGRPGTESLARRLGVRATPTVILVDREGTVRFAAEGRVDTALLEAHLREVAAPR